MGVETALIASTVLGGGSALASGYQAKKQGDYMRDQANADADAALAAGRAEATRIRRIAREQQSSSRAALAGAGVSVDTGTGADIQQDIGQAGEQDALSTLLNSQVQSRRLWAEGRGAALSGRQAMFGSVLSAGGQGVGAYGRWLRMSPLPAMQRAPLPPPLLRRPGVQ